MEGSSSTPSFSALIFGEGYHLLRVIRFFIVEKHFQKPFQAFCFKKTYFIYDLDKHEEFARTGAVMS